MATKRLNFYKYQHAFEGLLNLEKYISESKLDLGIFHLVKFRASQINKCAYCLDMHSIDALANGESDQRLFVLEAWREAPFYSDKERAALAWTEALTLISENEVSDELYETVQKYFDEEELMALTMTVIAINGLNRL